MNGCSQQRTVDFSAKIHSVPGIPTTQGTKPVYCDMLITVTVGTESYIGNQPYRYESGILFRVVPVEETDLRIPVITT